MNDAVQTAIIGVTGYAGAELARLLLHHPRLKGVPPLFAGRLDEKDIARGGVPLALVSVYRALGGGWQLRTGQELLPEAARKEMKDRTNWGHLPDEGAHLPVPEEEPQGNHGETTAH